MDTRNTVGLKTLRSQVYRAIDVERDYQDSLGPDRVGPSERPHSTGDYLTMMTTYLRKAQDAWTLEPGDKGALDQIRKIAAIAVHCMEDNGVVWRVRTSVNPPKFETIRN